MKLSKLTLAVATVLGASLSSAAFAMDLYVDTKTKQIFAEPGKNRVKLGSFEKVNESASKASESAALEEIRQNLELKENAIKALEEHIHEEKKDAAEVKMSDKGIEFESKDGNFKFAINGRLQVDSQVNVNGQKDNPLNKTTAKSNNLADGMSIRRARLGIEGTFYKDFDYKFEYDFTRGNGTTAAGVTDAYIAWNISKPFSVKVGSFKEPFSMEEATSNRYLTFIERNMAVNSFLDNPNIYKMGLGINYVEDRYGIMTALTTEPVGANGSNNTATGTNGNANRNGNSGDTSWGVGARAFGRPWMEDKEHFLHVGASGAYTSVNNNYNGTANGSTLNNGGMSYGVAVNSNVDRTNILNTGNLTNGPLGGATSHRVKSFTRAGVDTAFVYGPFSAQAEYLRTDISGTGYKNTSFDGYYGYMSYFLTGESRNYKAKTGAWDRIKPAHNFDMKGGWGAWELAAGYDYLDLNSATGQGAAVSGGRAATAKVGLNWYINSHVRFMADYVHVLKISMPTLATGNAAFNGSNPDMLETRVQVDW